jgi:hypothetical protein
VWPRDQANRPCIWQVGVTCGRKLASHLAQAARSRGAERFSECSRRFLAALRAVAPSAVHLELPFCAHNLQPPQSKNCVRRGAAINWRHSSHKRHPPVALSNFQNALADSWPPSALADPLQCVYRRRAPDHSRRKPKKYVRHVRVRRRSAAADSVSLSYCGKFVEQVLCNEVNTTLYAWSPVSRS